MQYSISRVYSKEQLWWRNADFVLVHSPGTLHGDIFKNIEKGMYVFFFFLLGLFSDAEIDQHVMCGKERQGTEAKTGVIGLNLQT